MKEYLRRWKLADSLTIQLEIEKSEFVRRFRQMVDDGDPSWFTSSFEAFSGGNNEYKGRVGQQGFKIRRRRRFFDFNRNIAIASGTYTQNNRMLTVQTEVNSFHSIMIPFYIFAVIFYIVFFAIIFAGNVEGGTPLFIAPFIIVHALFMLGVPYFMMRRSTKRMKHELEREFYYLTKDSAGSNPLY